MQSDDRNSAERRSKFVPLFPWLLLLPFPLCAATAWMLFAPGNVLYRLGLQGIAFASPLLSALAGLGFAALGVIAALRLGMRQKWRKLVTLILSGLHAAAAGVVGVLFASALIRVIRTLLSGGV